MLYYKQSVKEKNKDTKYITTDKVLSHTPTVAALASLSRAKTLRRNIQATVVYSHPLGQRDTESAEKTGSPGRKDGEL